MDKFVVRGGNPLLGTIKVSGAKNSALPCMAAAILTEDEVILENIPQVRDIETELRNRLRQEVRTSLIGELALRRLKEVDQVAYVRFASVYRQFADVEEFEEELARLEREPLLARGQVTLDEHLFGNVDPTNRNGSRVRLRALRGGRDDIPNDETIETVTTNTTSTTLEVPDGD